ncbi:MAG: electron transport complex subunit RsxC [Candidatus Thiodiazotropha sp. (ex Lucinoma kastoroae)]|nr:electron transport complex subunit RsxC [Candidatus Thiodiazotropha sp. (ex Lucinoma kastoroae)]MCU7860832.1 electron transport complex subunit RsxC [Candidatus Thiodiazotropha sp. (ex Lucinoma kastoroae)]
MLALFTRFKRSFSHGIHPDEYKDQTAALPTQRMPFVERYILPLHQHLGAPSKPLVEAGQQVRRGQLIAAPGAFVSTSLHSPVSGRVKAIGQRRFPGGRYEQAIEIEADLYATQCLEVDRPPDWRGLSLDDFVSVMQGTGIVGLGGASLPVHVKYSLREGVKIKHLIANGAECEPYLTNDHRVMVERPEALLRGIEILHTLLGAEESIIGIELNKPDAITSLGEHIPSDRPFRVAPLRVKYPQGDSKMMIKSLLNIEIPKGLHAADLGIIMNNVSTLVAIADYFDTGMPYIDRMVTVSGPGIEYPANLIVPLGTPVREVLRFCGGLKAETKEVLMGGPMMGTPIASLDAPIIKSSSGILAFTAQQTARPKEVPCIRCGRCVEACPYFLNPSKLARLVKARQFDKIKQANVAECVECGSCTYSCPSGIPIVQLIRSAKSEMRGKRGKA